MNKQEQFKEACFDGDLKTVKALINDPDVDPPYDDNDAVCWAAECGHKEVVELLLTDKRVMDKIDVALKWCKEWGGYEFLKDCVDEREPDVWELIAQMEQDADMWF